MKYIATVFCVISVGVIGVAIASEVTFVWDANVESDLAGYKIHYGTATGVYTQVIDIGSEEAAAGRNPACSVPYNPSDSVCCEYTIELDSGTYFFAATAYDDEGNESGPSAELTHTFYTEKPSEPFIVSPVEYYKISEAYQEFCWKSNDDTIDRWAIWIGTGTEGNAREDVYRRGFDKELRCKSIGPLPLDGGPLYLIFWWRIEDKWYRGNTITYSTVDKTAPTAPSEFRKTAD